MRFLLIIFLAAIIFSCGGDDPLMQATGTPASIIGKWYVTATALQLSVKGEPLKDYLIKQGSSPTEAQGNVDVLTDQTHWEGLFSTFNFNADGNWSVTTNNETGSGIGTWTITADQKVLTISPQNADQDMVAAVYELSKFNLQLGIELISQPKFGTVVDYLVVVKASRP